MKRLNIYARLGVPCTPNSDSDADSTTKFDPDCKFVTSPFMRPLVLAGVRLFVAGYVMVTLVVVLAWKAQITHDSQSFLSFFTYLTYIGLCAYYFASGTQTLAYSLTLRRVGRKAHHSSSITYPLQKWYRPLQALHVVLQASVVTFPFIVTIVFWSLLADSTTLSGSFLAWSNLSVHAFNTLFALFEILLTNAPPAPWLTLLTSLLFLVGYLGVAYITHATQGIYTYSFLNPSKQHGLVAAYIAGIALAECVVFLVIRYTIVLRERWATRARRLYITGTTTTRTPHSLSRNEHTGTEQDERDGGETGKSAEDKGGIEGDWEEVESPVVPVLKSAMLGGEDRGGSGHRGMNEGEGL